MYGPVPNSSEGRLYWVICPYVFDKAMQESYKKLMILDSFSQGST